MTKLNIFLFVILALAGGGLAGMVYFGGLWITVKGVVEHKKPAMLLVLSFLIRISIAGAVFYALMMYQWAYLAVAMVSFMAVRQLMVKKLGQPKTLSE